MKIHPEFIQCHNGLKNFNYNLAVEWAIDLIRNGVETKNILMLASFSKPIDSYQIKPYVSAVLRDFNLVEKNGDEAVFALIHFYLTEILQHISIRRFLNSLYELYMEKDSFPFSKGHKFRLQPFYLLYHGWNDLDENGSNYHFEDANLDNIEEVIKEQARIWIAEQSKVE